MAKGTPRAAAWRSAGFTCTAGTEISTRSGVLGSEAMSGQQRMPATVSRFGLTSITSPLKSECLSRLMSARPPMLPGSSEAPTRATERGEHRRERSGSVSCMRTAAGN